MSQRRARDIGLDIPLPPKSCEDQNCPFHGRLSVRGITVKGKIVKIRMDKTAVIESNYLHYSKKYKRYERRRRKISVHLPPCLDVEEGDEVTAAECRSISKTVSFVVISK